MSFKPQPDICNWSNQLSSLGFSLELSILEPIKLTRPGSVGQVEQYIRVVFEPCSTVYTLLITHKEQRRVK